MQAQTSAGCPPQAQSPTAPQLQAAAANARDRGLLWRVTRDGRTAYLYGSIHVGKLDWAFPGPQVTAALMASDTVALEIDIGDPQMAARLQAAGGYRHADAGPRTARAAGAPGRCRLPAQGTGSAPCTP